MKKALKRKQSQKTSLQQKSTWNEKVGGAFRSILKSVDAFLDQRTMKYIVSPLALALLPSFVLLYFARPPVQMWVNANLPDLGGFIQAQAIGFSIGAVIWPILLPKLRLLIQDMSKNPVEHTAEGLIALLEQLSNIVGTKGRRFAEAVNELPKTPEAAFSRITQPEAQLLEIVRAIYEYFKLFCEDRRTGIRVNIAVIGQDGKIQSIKFHHPPQNVVRSDVSSLNNPNSTISYAVKTKKIVVIESIKKESQRNYSRFVVTDQSRADEDGSLICYPIVHPATNKVQFVLSISCTKSMHFDAAKSPLYRDILGHFALRINLEYSLLVLKEITNG